MKIKTYKQTLKMNFINNNYKYKQYKSENFLVILIDSKI